MGNSSNLALETGMVIESHGSTALNFPCFEQSSATYFEKGTSTAQKQMGKLQSTSDSNADFISGVTSPGNENIMSISEFEEI